MNRTAIDRTTLPAAMVDMAKAEMRVRHSRDDALIAEDVQKAIDMVERRSNCKFFAATYEISAAGLFGYAWGGVAPMVRYPLPVNNVVSIASFVDGTTDLAPGYKVESPDLGGNGQSYLVGMPLTSGAAVLTVKVGFDDPADLAGSVKAAIYRIAAAYYEARESFAPIWDEMFAAELKAIWRPSA
jgi:uncharacterized phiE125 gp8 family phage protein